MLKEMNKTMENGNYINISELMRKALKGWKTIAISVVVAGIVGLVFILTTPRRYQSMVQLAPEQMVVNDEKAEAIFPEIYPNIVGANDFILDLFPLEVTKADGSLTTDYKTYLLKHQKKSLMEYPKSWLIRLVEMMRGQQAVGQGDANGPIRLSRHDEELMKGIRGVIRCVWDKKTDAITISVIDQDPLIAAVIADSVTSHLQKSITEYRTAKARVDLEYAQRIYDQTHEDFEAAENTYSTYADAYQQATQERYKQRAESLKKEMQLRFDAFCDASEQLQAAKAKLQEQTPAFTVIQTSMVAGKPYGASRAMRLLMWLMLGGFIGCCIVWKK